MVRGCGTMMTNGKGWGLGRNCFERWLDKTFVAFAHGDFLGSVERRFLRTVNVNSG